MPLRLLNQSWLEAGVTSICFRIWHLKGLSLLHHPTGTLNLWSAHQVSGMQASVFPGLHLCNQVPCVWSQLATALCLRTSGIECILTKLSLQGWWGHMGPCQPPGRAGLYFYLPRILIPFSKPQLAVDTLSSSLPVWALSTWFVLCILSISCQLSLRLHAFLCLSLEESTYAFGFSSLYCAIPLGHSRDYFILYKNIYSCAKPSIEENQFRYLS